MPRPGWFVVGRCAERNPDLGDRRERRRRAGPVSPVEVLAQDQQLCAMYCAACHQADGSGNNGPSLRSSANMRNATFIARQIRGGMSEMPGFGSVLDNEDLAAVATDVRGSFGNGFPPMEPADFVR